MKEVEQPRPLSTKNWFLARLIYVIVQVLARTLRLKIDREAELEAFVRQQNGAILLAWHGRTLIPIFRFRKRGYWALISLSKDGDLISEVFRLFKMRVVRGSTGRRGIAATREMLTALANGATLLVAPDGPRGPYGMVKPGALYLAQRSGKPIIIAGIAAYPRTLVNSWDRFMVPGLFAQARWIYGDPIFIGPQDDLDEAGRRVSAALHALEQAAEAAVGTPLEERISPPTPEKPSVAVEEDTTHVHVSSDR